MQQFSPTILDRLRHWRSALHVVVFVLLAQAFIPAGLAFAADAHGDTDLETVICRTLVDQDDDGLPDGDTADDCSLCIALDMGKVFLTDVDAGLPVFALTSASGASVTGNSLSSTEYGSSQQVRAPPLT